MELGLSITLNCLRRRHAPFTPGIRYRRKNAVEVPQKQDQDGEFGS